MVLSLAERSLYVVAPSIPMFGVGLQLLVVLSYPSGSMGISDFKLIVCVLPLIPGSPMLVLS